MSREQEDNFVPAWMRQFLHKRLGSTTAEQHAGKQVRELLDHPGWKLIDAMVDEQSDRLMASLEGSQIPDHVEYAARHGERSGLRFVRGAAEAVLRVAESADRRARESSKLGDG